MNARSFDPSVREFLDSWQGMSEAQRRTAIEDEPELLGDPIADAYLAALAEHLALTEGGIGPAWSERPNRFLKVPFFSGGLESLKAILLVESPLAFRRRLIFISNDALARPKRHPLPAD